MPDLVVTDENIVNLGYQELAATIATESFIRKPVAVSAEVAGDLPAG